MAKITTDLAVDPPVELTARYSFTKEDRAFIDAQIRGCEQHIVDSLIRGVVATWDRVSSGSASLSPGDVVCLGASATGTRTVTLATPAALVIAGKAHGVVLEAAAVGAMVRYAVGGTVDPTVTGLAATSGFARVTAVGRCERVATLAAGDFPVGAIDATGYVSLALNPAATATASGFGVAVADAAALSLLDDTAFEEGAGVFVASFGRPFYLRQADSTALKTGVVIDSLSTTARWHTSSDSDGSWLYQLTWYLDPAGDDENDGATTLTPLQTHDEYERRIAGRRTPAAHTIRLLGTIPGAVVVHTNATDDTTSPTYEADASAVTQLYAGTFTNFAQIDETTLQDGLAEDTAIPTSWTASGLVDGLVRITSGPRAGVEFWAKVDLGTKVARITQPVAAAFNSTPINTVAIGDPYAVYSLPRLGDTLRVESHGGFGARVTFRDIQLGTTTSIAAGDVRVGSCLAPSLDIKGGARVELFNCNAGSVTAKTGSSLHQYQGGSDLIVGEGATIRLDRVWMQNGGCVLSGGVCTVDGWLAVFDGAGGATVQNMGLLDLATGAAKLWGRNIAGVAAAVGSFSWIRYALTIPIAFTSVGGEVTLGGTTFLFSDLPRALALKGCGIIT